ncbi:MAG: hypothetical protein WC503_04300 [Candidatus Shapirobacteria bacterium]
MIKRILVLTGLDQEKTLPIFKLVEGKLSRELGIETRVFNCGWEKRKSFKEIENSLFKKIESVDGEIILFGISAGMVAALAAKNKYGVKIPKVISLCGWSRPKIKFTYNERKYYKALVDRNIVFKEAVAEYTKIYKNILPKDWKNMMVFWAENDEYIPKSCCVHRGMKATEMKILTHVGGILLALTRTKEIMEFIEK